MPESKDDPNWFFDAWGKQRDEASEDYGLTPYVLVTAPRLQLSKTAFTITMGEELMERGLGPAGREKFDIRSQMTFEIPPFMEAWRKVPEWSPLILDEPNRPASNRRWHEPANNALAEWLQTRSYEHRPSWFPLPHEHLLDNAIVRVCTSQAVIGPSRGYATFYQEDPDMLNRSGRTRTPKIGTLSFRKPYPEDWEVYLKARIEYNRQRGELLIQQARSIDRKADRVQFKHDDIVSVILATPTDFRGEKGQLSPTRVTNMIPGVSYGSAQKAVDDVKRLLVLRDKAERQA